MKKLFTILTGIVFSITILVAQEAPPQAFSFKAVITKNGSPVVNKLVYLQISILQDYTNGPAVYMETFTPTSNELGQVDLEVGRGNVLIGDFSAIAWPEDEYFFKIEYTLKEKDPYQTLSITQLLSVPYSLYSGEAGNGFAKEYTPDEIRPVLNPADGSLNLGTPPDEWIKLNVSGMLRLSPNNKNFWGSTIVLDSRSRPGGEQYVIASLAEGASEGEGNFLIRKSDDWESTFIMDNQGNVGIGLGQASPNQQYKLDVNGNLNFSGELYKNGILFDTPVGFVTEYTEGEMRPVINLENGHITLGGAPDWWSKLRVDGGLGITPGPENSWGATFVLDARGQEGGLQYNISSLSAGSSEGAGKFQIADLAGNSKFIMDNGHIGINNLNPGYSLDVAGDINFSGTLLKNGEPFNIEDAVTLSGDQTIEGNKTFSNDITVNGLTVGKGRNAIFANMAIGEYALGGNNSGFGGNIAVGMEALVRNETGHSNTAVGVQALSFNTTGIQNTAIGVKVLELNREGANNVAVGVLSLYNNYDGDRNIAIGASALYNNYSGTVNTAIGTEALFSNTDGVNNTAIGFGALHDIKTGNANTAIGAFANVSGDNLSNATVIGWDARVSASNNFVFGNKQVVGWGFGVDPGSAAIRVGSSATNGNGATLTPSGVWTDASDISKKYNIEEINYGLGTVMSLHPVTYKLKGLDTQDIGFIAQEVKEVVPEIVYGADGEMTMSYGQLTSILVKAIQEQQLQIEGLNAIINQLMTNQVK